MGCGSSSSNLPASQVDHPDLHSDHPEPKSKAPSRPSNSTAQPPTSEQIFSTSPQPTNMSKPTIHLFPVSTASRPVQIFLAASGVEHELKIVDMAKGEHKSPEFLAINPEGQVPALTLDDGTVITDSVAIISYLSEISGWAKTPIERALTMRTLMWNADHNRKHGLPAYYAIIMAIIYGVPFDAESCKKNLALWKATLQKMNDVYLKDTKFFNSDKISAGDIYLVSDIVAPFAIFSKFNLDIGFSAADFPKVEAYVAAVRAHSEATDAAYAAIDGQCDYFVGAAAAKGVTIALE